MVPGVPFISYSMN